MMDLTSLPGWSAEEYARLKCDKILGSKIVTRVRHGLGGSHSTVTYPPLDALEPMRAEALIPQLCPSAGIHLYAHVPYCEHVCLFCHYAKTYSPIGGESEFVRHYLEALFAEIDTWSNYLAGSTIASLFIGGGTPTVLGEDRLVRLFQKLTVFKRTRDFVACIETSPLTATAPGGAQKLRMLVEAGVGRVSLGIQTFDDSLLHKLRGHGEDIAIKAADAVAALGIDYNIDLIQDLPFQTDGSLLHDLEWISRFKPPQVTWYILRVHQEAAWFSSYMRADLELATPQESARRRLMIREGMRRLGYLERPGGRFVAEAQVHDRFKDVRAGSEATLLGVGVSSYSHGWGYFFRNAFVGGMKAGIHGYVDRIRRDGMAVETGRRLDEVEMMASRFVSGIRTGVRLPAATLKTQGYLAETEVLLERLCDQGLVEVDPTGTWSLTSIGRVFEEEICSLFFSAPVRRQLVQKNSYWHDGRTTGSGGGLSEEPGAEESVRIGA